MMEPLSQLTVGKQCSLRNVMEAIDRGGRGIAAVTDESGRLLGVMTDGDVRRAILSGASVEDCVEPFVVRGYKSVSPAVDRSEVLDLMQAMLLSQIPIVNDEGRLMGWHLLREIIGAERRSTWAVIMAGR